MLSITASTVLPRSATGKQNGTGSFFRINVQKGFMVQSLKMPKLQQHPRLTCLTLLQWCPALRMWHERSSPKNPKIEVSENLWNLPVRKLMERSVSPFTNPEGPEFIQHQCDSSRDTRHRDPGMHTWSPKQDATHEDQEGSSRVV